MNRLNVRQEIFAQGIVKGLLPARTAYAKAYNRNPDNTAAVEGHRLLNSPNVQERIEKLKETIKKDADWAYNSLKQMAEDKKTPPAERRKIYEAILSRAGTDAAQKVEQKNEVQYKEFDLSREQLIEMLMKPTGDINEFQQ